MPDDVVVLIWEALGGDRLTTKEASDRLDHLFNYRCPDDIAKTLSKLRKAGLIKGEISMDAGGWIWWADDECRSNRIKENK
ncbi:MAG: hypothetical protein LBR42_01880 [Candidatus Methanoplasma sp.]|jgi:hypothetical protein|nr:hypothetical protein [Candidatus Methanoplasma sp.]